MKPSDFPISGNKFLEKVSNDENFLNRLEGYRGQKKNKEIENELRNIGNPLDWDPKIYYLIIGFLGFTLILALIGGILIVMVDRSIPEMLVALGSASIGALAGLLAPKK